MRIGLDYDGTIADANIMKSEWIKNNLGLNIPSWKTDRTSCIPALTNYMPLKEAERIYNGFQDFIYTGDYAKATPEIPGAIEGIKQLAKNHRLWIVTARPVDMVPDSLDWLANKSILRHFEGWYSSRSEDKLAGKILSKQEICESYRLDVIVDDDERHLNKIELPNLVRILIKNGSNESKSSDGIYVANNWEDVVRVINSA